MRGEAPAFEIVAHKAHLKLDPALHSCSINCSTVIRLHRADSSSSAPAASCRSGAGSWLPAPHKAWVFPFSQSTPSGCQNAHALFITFTVAFDGLAYHQITQTNVFADLHPITSSPPPPYHLFGQCQRRRRSQLLCILFVHANPESKNYNSSYYSRGRSIVLLNWFTLPL